MRFIPETMIYDYGEEVYEKVSELTGLKFKTQMKGSGIVFQNIYEVHDLVSGQRHYAITTNSNMIKFRDRDEFIQRFIEWIKKSIEQLNADYRDLEKQQSQAVVDENLIFIENERIGYTGQKQLKLLNKMRDFRGEFPNLNKH